MALPLEHLTRYQNQQFTPLDKRTNIPADPAHFKGFSLGMVAAYACVKGKIDPTWLSSTNSCFFVNFQPIELCKSRLTSVVNHLRMFNILTSAESSIPSKVSFTVTFSIKAFCLLVAFVLFVTQMKWCLESNKNLFYF